MGFRGMSPKQMARMIEVYNSGDTQEDRDSQVEQLAVEFNKKAASVRSKMSNMPDIEYVAKTYKNKQGESSVRKATFVSMIAEAMGQTEDAFDSLSKATKPVLETIWEFVKPEPVENDSQPEEDTPEEA